MKLEEFLDRVIAPGNWMAMAHKGDNYHAMAHQFYDRATGIDKMAKDLRWLSQRVETWYAMASFTDAAPTSDGKKIIGKRTAQNAQAIKAFWCDADIKRDGDGKDPAKVFASEVDVITWVKAFVTATGIPKPNIWVKSGYGLHLYWSFVDALDVPTWRSYAEVLKSTLVQHKFLGDINVVADAARILRAPETLNHKVPEKPVPCFEFVPGKLTLPDYANALLLPTINSNPAFKPGRASSSTTGSATSTGNAKSGLSHQPRDFQIMAANCAQVEASLNNNGADDGYLMWLGMVRLAKYTEDGRHWAHEVSKAHPKYTPVSTDAKFDDAIESQKSGYGPPRCTSISDAAVNTPREGICQACPHWGKPHITTPFHVAVPGFNDPDAMPNNWRRDPASKWLERNMMVGKGKAAKREWVKAVEGDVTNVDLVGGNGQSYELIFNYTPPNNPPIRLSVNTIEMDARAARALLCSRGMFVEEHRARHASELLMSWIAKLRRECRVRTDPMPSFGWYKDGANYKGFATGGVCYVANGADEAAPGADPALVSRYTPHGMLDDWRKAAEFVAADTPELHTLIAVAFGSPLVELAGAEAGAVLNFVGASGVGKSSATKAGQAVWAHPIRGSFSVDDTANYKAKTAGDIRALPVYWDEARLDADIKRTISEIHKFTQGRDKGRLNSNITVRDPGVWATLYAISSNDSLRDLVAAQPEDTDATLARILEIRVEQRLVTNHRASFIVSSLNNNYGVAGQVYARYIADNTKVIQTVLNRTMDAFNKRLGLSVDERFYGHSAATIIVGAKLAKRLGLMNFDIDGIVSVLENSINVSRGVRTEAAPQDPVIRLTRQLDSFFNKFVDEYVVTSFFKKTGPSSKPTILHQPQNAPRSGFNIAYHVGLNEKVVRINTEAWNAYWLGRNSSGASIREELTARWGIASGVDPRGMGHGTEYKSRAYYFALSLDNPELGEFLDQWDTTGSGAAPAANVVPMKRP